MEATLQNNTAAPVRALPAASTRLGVIDVLRGFALVLMLISHAPSFVEINGYSFRAAYGWDTDVVPPAGTPESIIGFVLHIATPIFFLLAGFSVAFFVASRRKRGWSEWQITRFFIIRGLVLIALEWLVVNFRISGNQHFALDMSVLTVTGVGLILLAFLRRLPLAALGALALGLLLSTQIALYLGGQPQHESVLGAMLLAMNGQESVNVLFPLLPWLPLLLFGFISGQIIRSGTIGLGRYALAWGIGLVLLSIVIKLVGGFGTLYPASPFVFTKHPPDLAFLSFYTGMGFLLMAALTTIPAPERKPGLAILAQIGQAGLFFYIVHWRIAYIVAVPVWGLEISYLYEALLIAALTFIPMVGLCALYLRFKRRYPESILQYF